MKSDKKDKVKKISKKSTTRKNKKKDKEGGSLRKLSDSKKKSGKEPKDVEKLVELLQIHQIELEHQNQELRNTQQELEESRNRYVDLFDFSPIPYFTLDSDGIIKEVNLSAGKMLGIERKYLMGRNLNTYIHPQDRDIYTSFLKSLFNSSEKQSCELKILNKDKRLFQVLLEGLMLDDMTEPNRKCHIAIIDLSKQKKIEDDLNKANNELKQLQKPN